MPNGSEKTPEWARYLSAEVRAMMADAEADRKLSLQYQREFGQALAIVDAIGKKVLGSLRRIETKLDALDRIEKKLGA